MKPIVPTVLFLITLSHAAPSPAGDARENSDIPPVSGGAPASENPTPRPSSGEGPLRVLFLGHDARDLHPSDLYYPMLAKALGRKAIYFDYVTTPEEAFADCEKLFRYDAVLLYANHKTLDRKLWRNLRDFVTEGGGFVPVHSASWCFQNILEYDRLVGGRFRSHGTGVFEPRTIAPDHPAISGTPPLRAWDETYHHINHNESNRTVLQVREGPEGDPRPGPEPWTWVRTEGKGRVFYTASGHDERVWSRPEFHALLESGIRWAVGDRRRASYDAFLSRRTPLRYEPRSDIPNYENRPKPLPYQFPLSPEDSMDYLRAPLGWRVERFAAEPDIINPIALTWDERGRLWTAETVDYPNQVRPQGGNDVIKILEDTDGDGRCDRVEIFAEGLNIPTSLAVWNEGLLVAQAPDILFLQDTDGDSRADRRETVITGWGTGDTHAGPANLRYGIDNWIYGTVGYAGFRGEVGGELMRFHSGIFRFRPDGSKMEFLHQFNNNTWGLGFNAAGDTFGSTANSNPAFFGGFPQTGYRGGKPGPSAKMIANEATFHPITPNIRQVDAFGEYTSGAGYTLATSDQFPPDWRDRMAFISGPTGHLLGMFEHRRHGAGYRAINRFHLLASADEWFSPVAAEIGPDGHLWVADWYNFIVQHNPTPTPERGGYAGVRGAGNAHENPLRDRQHGRIYRVIWEGASAPAISSLEDASDDELLGALSHHNQFWRLTAQRILVARQRKDLAPRLKERLWESRGPAAAHMLWTLEGIGELDADTHQRALLSHGDSILKRNAIRAIGNTPEGMRLFFDTAVVQAEEPLVRLAAFSKLAHFPDRRRAARVAAKLMQNEENRSDEWLALALRAAGADEASSTDSTSMGPNLLPNASFEEVADGMPSGWQVRTYRGRANHQIDHGTARTGERSLRISSREGADTSLFTRVTVKPHTEYRLSGWVKTENLQGARGAQLNAHEIQGQPGSRTGAHQGDSPEWTRVESVFSSGDRSELTVNCLFGGWGTSTGMAWWDDVSLREIIDEPPTSRRRGDPEKGRMIFNTHALAACNRCHQVQGEGGPIGPALDGIASRLSEEQIHESLVDPQATIAEGYAAEVSPMPPVGVLLNEEEMGDLMAYLLTLTD